MPGAANDQKWRGKYMQWQQVEFCDAMRGHKVTKHCIAITDFTGFTRSYHLVYSKVIYQLTAVCDLTGKVSESCNQLHR